MAKPKGSGIPVKELREVQLELGEFRVLLLLVSMTEIMNELVKEGELKPYELALLDISSYLEAFEAGLITFDEINYIMERRKLGVESVLVPTAYLKSIMSVFKQYFERNGEITLGEAFKFEGGGQGRQKRMNSIKALLRDIRLCDRVLFVLGDAEWAGQPISREVAFQKVADISTAAGEKASPDIVKRAFERYGDRVRKTFLGNMLDA